MNEEIKKKLEELKKLFYQPALSVTTNGEWEKFYDSLFEFFKIFPDEAYANPGVVKKFEEMIDMWATLARRQADKAQAFRERLIKGAPAWMEFPKDGTEEEQYRFIFIFAKTLGEEMDKYPTEKEKYWRLAQLFVGLDELGKIEEAKKADTSD